MTTMSKAALPPIQPTSTGTERAHPRFNEYRQYVAGCSCKLITADSFALWLRSVEENERSFDHVFKTGAGASDPFVSNRWYKHRFAPGHKLISRLGPFTTREEAEVS